MKIELLCLMEERLENGYFLLNWQLDAPLTAIQAYSAFRYQNKLYVILNQIEDKIQTLSKTAIGLEPNTLLEVDLGGRFDSGSEPDLIIGCEEGLAAAIYWARRSRKQKPWVLLSSQEGFPFKPVPSQYLLPMMPPGVIGAAPLLEDSQIPSRLVSKAELGSYDGNVLDLALLLEAKTVVCFLPSNEIEAAMDLGHWVKVIL